MMIEIDRQFTEEMNAVRQLLNESGAALEMPLRALVEAQIEQSRPEIHAAVVLVTAVTAAADDEGLRQQRINLAAALEMLYVALNVHKLLLRDDPTPADKSLLGGTILAGDYCFSQAANLAVKTNHAQVVTIFSEALKETSEGNLRYLFAEAAPRFSEHQALCRSGIHAGAALIGAPASTGPVDPLIDLIETFVHSYETGTPVSPEADSLIARLPEPQRTRAAYLQIWLEKANAPS
jgi:octaprenyl-diphosphate synthase